MEDEKKVTLLDLLLDALELRKQNVCKVSLVAEVGRPVHVTTERVVNPRIPAPDPASITRREVLVDAREYAELRRHARYWRWVRDQAGYHQDGSESTVTLVQDDATRSAFIHVGKRCYGTDGSTFEGIIEGELAKENDHDA